MAERVALTGYPDLDDDERLRRVRAFEAAMTTRRSVREFATTPVARAVIESAIRAAGRAPSGANMQPWTFVAVSDPAVKRRIRMAAEEEERAFYGGRLRCPPKALLRQAVGRARDGLPPHRAPPRGPGDPYAHAQPDGVLA